MKNNHFLFAPLIIFIVGVSSILFTRFLLYTYRPEYFDGRIPSISKTAAFTPGVYLFTTGMIVVCVCIFITVSYVQQIYHDRLSRLDLPKNEIRYLTKNCDVGCFIARTAGIFLVLLSIISLEVNDPLHIVLSILFFASQNLAFVYDFVCTKTINRNMSTADAIPLNGKHILFFIITLLSFFYLFMFLYKDSAIFPDNYLAHQVYTVTEYSWASLAFLYPALYYPLIKKEFGDTSCKYSHVS